MIKDVEEKQFGKFACEKALLSLSKLCLILQDMNEKSINKNN